MSAGADPATEGAIGSRPLTSDEVRARVADGRSNRTEHTESRSVASILRANILTRFNAIISVMVVVILVFISLGVYSVSKAGILMLTQVLAQELGAKNIQVNAIAPGVIKTRFSQVLWQMPEFARPILDRLPLARFGEPEDVAGLALYLASPESDYVTGSLFVLDGGMNVASPMG